MKKLIFLFVFFAIPIFAVGNGQSSLDKQKSYLSKKKWGTIRKYTGAGCFGVGIFTFVGLVCTRQMVYNWRCRARSKGSGGSYTLHLEDDFLGVSDIIHALLGVMSVTVCGSGIYNFKKGSAVEAKNLKKLKSIEKS